MELAKVYLNNLLVDKFIGTETSLENIKLMSGDYGQKILTGQEFEKALKMAYLEGKSWYYTDLFYPNRKSLDEIKLEIANSLESLTAIIINENLER